MRRCWLALAGLIIVTAASPAAAQESLQSRADELRGDIAKIRAAMGVLTRQLEALEKELAAVEPRASVPTRPVPYVPAYRHPLPPGLRFPVDVERAMMGGAVSEPVRPRLESRLNSGETRLVPSPRK